MVSPLQRISGAVLRNLAESLDSGRLLPPFTALSLQRYVPVSESAAVAQELAVLSGDSANVLHLGYILRMMAEARATSGELGDRVELVWSGPELPGAASRDTGVVVRELFSSAQTSVLVAGFSISRGPEIFRALADRMVALPDLTVRMFLNVAREGDDQSSSDGVVNSFYRLFKSKHWPWKKLPMSFTIRGLLKPNRQNGLPCMQSVSSLTASVASSAPQILRSLGRLGILKWESWSKIETSLRVSKTSLSLW